MRKLTLFLLLFLATACPLLAEPVIRVDLTYSNGTKAQFTSEDEFEKGFAAFIDDARDGTMEYYENGVLQGTIVKAGDQFTMTDAKTKEVEQSTASELHANMAKAKAYGQLTGCKSNLKNIATALEMWSTDHGGKYPDALQDLTPDYLKRIPTCPISETDTYSSTYKQLAEPVYYEFNCTGNHSAADCPAGYPAYDGAHGVLRNAEDRKPPQDPEEE